MNLARLIFLFFLSSCATKFILPGNRFITPETQGGAFNGQFELNQASANMLTINTSRGTVNNGVIYNEVNRVGFLLANSIFEKLDFVWSHTGGGNSLVGGKFQILGPSKLAKGQGHKLAIGALIGENDYETSDNSIEFSLAGSEYFITYGFRINENVLPYVGFFRSTYNFKGKIHSSNNRLNGLEPKINSILNTLTAGVELTYQSFVMKIETGRQEIYTSDTKDKTRFIFGYSFGVVW